jgi:DNA-binding CsgD family transcriptional regulator
LSGRCASQVPAYSATVTRGARIAAFRSAGVRHDPESIRRRLLARCEGAVTPPIQTMTARLRLTPGELDTAVQAAAGRTNKQIAGDMHLSVRTVESHLQRTYEKLGISGRHELADALRNQPTA